MIAIKKTAKCNPLFVVALLAIGACFSCKKSAPAKSIYSITATVNGTAYTSGNCVAAINGTELSIMGGSGLPYINLIIPGFLGVNSYTITPSTTGTTADIDSSSIEAPAIGQYGNITITAISPNITGNFNFTALAVHIDTTQLNYGYSTDSVTVNGSFVAKLIP